MNSSEPIKRAARDLGFDLVGITTAEPPPHAVAYRQWLADGFHGTMSYLERAAGKRCDPQLVLPGAKSIIVVGWNYCPSSAVGSVSNRDRSGMESPPTTARLARYATGTRDYHEVMGEKLAKLAALVDGLWYVDTGPVLERDLAQRAGIGWVGKHTNLINRQLGNWFFLGAVLTRMELPVDEPARPHCGKCTRCLTACPTGAIVAPYRLDARRCISYLTIELKGSIPVELRPKIGNRVFGCDDCLAVCPWNRFARPAVVVGRGEPSAAGKPPARPFLVNRADEPAARPDLDEMLGWTDRQFADFFRGTPIYRLGRGRWLRNVCVVLGNLRDRSVARALDDPDPLVREHAAWAVAQIDNRIEPRQM